jgi:ribonuclease J
MGDFRDLVLRDRQHLATDGLVMVVLARSTQDGTMVGEPEVIFRGFAHTGDLDELTEEAKRRVVASMSEGEAQQMSDLSLLKTRVHDVLQKYLHKELDRRPMVLPVIVEV